MQKSQKIEGKEVAVQFFGDASLPMLRCLRPTLVEGSSAASSKTAILSTTEKEIKSKFCYHLVTNSRSELAIKYNGQLLFNIGGLGIG